MDRNFVINLRLLTVGSALITETAARRFKKMMENCIALVVGGLDG